MATSTVTELLQQVHQYKLADYIQSAPVGVQEALVNDVVSLDIHKTFGPVQDILKRHRAIKCGDHAEGKPEPPAIIDCSQWTPNDLESKLHQVFADPDAVVIQVKKNHLQQSTLKAVETYGLNLIQQGKVACVLLAGGQGTRLGFDGPKGCYRPGFPSGKSIFEILFERIVRIKNLAGSNSLPVYVMTSEANYDDTISFFESHDYFGLPREDTKVFNQSMMPSFDMNGDVFLQTEYSVTRNSNGNGGVFESLHSAGMLEDMSKRGVESLHVFGVDNVLVRIADPCFVGLCHLAKVPLGNKCCTKRDPHERVGVQAILHTQDNKRQPCVVEYSEITKQQAEATTTDGKQLLFSAANICNHYFSLDFIQNLMWNELLKYHVAEKKISYWDPVTRSEVKPNEINGYKLEYFIFDAFLEAKKLLAFEVDRSEEFSPVKNMCGIDSPATAVKDITDLHRKWIMRRGFTGSDQNVMKEGYMIEVSSLISYAGESEHPFDLSSKEVFVLPV